MNNDNLVKKTWDIYEFIQNELYLNRPDVEIGGKVLNAALLMGFLTALNQGKEIITGEPGLGKTTSAEYICSMLYRFPLGLIWASVVSGHPEQTEEKIIGRPDLGRLNQGEEVVVWSYFAQLPVKIVDEINRLPETKQSIILDGVDRGKWGYMNGIIINDEFCLFATANYQDRGTNTLIGPMTDRFDVLVESKHPGPNMAFKISMKDRSSKLLRDTAFENKFNELLLTRMEHLEKIKLIEALCNEFGAAVEDNIQIPLLSHKERIAIRENILAMPLDLDARAFLRTVIAELSFCCKFGQKRTGEKCEDGCHYSGYTCFHTKTCISNRFPISVKLYAQSLGWLMGDTEVNINHIKTVMPYNLGHRLQLRDEYVSLKQFRTRKDSLQIHLAKEIVDEIYKRYTEQSSHIKSALSVAYQNLTGNAIDPIKGDHPVYEEIRRDIEEGIGWVNLFEDFKDYAYEITPGFTGPKVQAKKSLLDFMMEGYSSCLKLKRQDLIQMVENLQTNKAYKVAVDFIYDLEYEAEDIEAFFYELSKKNGGTIPLEESGLTGVYISAMLNHIDDEEIELNLKPLKQKIDFLGYQLPMGKTVRLKGDAGNFAGAELNGGDLKIEGSCGDWTGAGMKAGKLSITHDVGIKTGDWKTGGEIHVGGVIGSMGLHNHGGLVYQAHRLKKS